MKYQKSGDGNGVASDSKDSLNIYRLQRDKPFRVDKPDIKARTPSLPIEFPCK